MKLKYNRANAYSVNGVTLLPNVNQISDKQYKAIKDNVGFKSRVAMGAIVLMKSETPETPETPATILNNEDPKDVVEKINAVEEAKPTKKTTVKTK